MNQLLKWIIAIGTVIGFPITANSQSFPHKPIKIVVPFASGSGTDAVARLATQSLVEALKQQVIVENRPGANGVIAAEFVAKSAPDGYTLFLTTNSTQASNPSLMKSIPYDPIKDFASVARLGNFPASILAIDPRLPVKSVAELISYAKINPGKLSYATGNSMGMITGATFARMAGIDLLQVPYKSTPPAMTDVMGGQVSMMFTDIMTAISNIRAGKIRALAVASKEPSSLLPEVPPMARTPGLEEFNWVPTWVAVFAPAGTPPSIIDVLNREFVKIVTRKDIVDRFTALGFNAFGSTPQELSAFVASEISRWKKLVKDAGIQPE